MEVDKESIKSFLPHRDPFLFLDAIESIEVPGKDRVINGDLTIKEMEGIKVKAHFHTNEKMDLFQGHFPGNPILPGVIQIEMMAQAACFGLRKIVSDNDPGPLEVALLKVEDAKFRKPVGPNEDLVIMATCVKARGSNVVYDCEISSNGEKCSQAIVWATHNVKKGK